MTQEKKKLGTYIRKYRKSKNISREELTEKTQVAAPFIAQIESGEIANLVEFVKICRTLKISLYSLPCDCVKSNDEEILSMLTRLTEQDKVVIQIVMNRILESRRSDGEVCEYLA